MFCILLYLEIFIASHRTLVLLYIISDWIKYIDRSIILLCKNITCFGRGWLSSGVYVFHNIWCTWLLLTTKCTMLGHWWTPVCNLLGYRRHRSVSITLFIYDSTTRRYNLSFTISPDPLMSCLGAVLGYLLCSFFYLCLSRMLTANSGWLCLCLSLCVCRPLNPVFAYGIGNTLSQGSRFPS
jgi:hypothetical protein